MVQLQSFEGEVAHATKPDLIAQKMGHVVCEGMRESQWVLPGDGTVCVLHSYDQLRTTVDGEQVVLDQPHHLLEGIYKRDDGQHAKIQAHFTGSDTPGEVRGVRADFWRDTDGQRHNFQAEVHPDEADFIVRIMMQAGLDAADAFHDVQTQRAQRTKELAEEWARKNADAEMTGTSPSQQAPVLEAVPDLEER